MVRINGNTYSAEVTAEDRLKVDSSSHTPSAIAADLQNSYIITVAADPSATTADFFYLKNNSNLSLKIPQITAWLNPSTTGPVEISVTTGVTGSPDTGVAVVPVNVFTGGKAADATCEQRDGDMALAGGTTVVILRVEEAVIGEQTWSFPAPIILPPDTALVFNNDIDPVGQDIDMSVHIYFE